MKHKGKKILSLLLAVLMLVGLTMPAEVLSQPARAAAGQTPAHSKSVTSNGDGTYTIELTVTGDAESETTVTGAVNVIVVIDTSRSMTSNNTTYGNSTVTRADAAEKVVYDFAHGLFGYTAKGADVQMALVTFNRNASVVQGWTSTESDITGKLSPDGTNGSRKLTYNSGTNWEAALQALTREDEDNPGLLRTADKDNTFVIFVTDGAPSLYVGSNFNGSGYADTDNERLACYNNSKDEAYTIQQFQTNGATEKNTTLYAIYAFGDEADLLDDLIYFSNNNADRPEADGGVTGSTVATEGYFSAGSTDELQKAIAKIFKDIADFMGIAAVSIDDGTTSDVAVEGGEVVDLLEIDEDSYQYWLTVPLNSSMQFTRVNSDAQTITYTVTEDEETEGKYKISWGSGDNAKSVTVEGSITSTGDLRYEWTGSDDLYAKAPPEAKLVGSSVKWDLNSVGTLLTGVTYSVTFEVYPSQTTLDILADMKNDPYVDAEHTGAWGKLPAEVRKYIDKESGALTTNTGAKLTYTDTRLEEPKPTTSDFNEVDGVESKAVEQLALAKKWMNALDKYTSEPITFDVLRDGKKQYTVTLSDDNDWSGSVYISIGIINKRGKVVSGSEGHDFTFKEPENVSYHWELDIPTVHPMMINGKVTMLIKVDAKHPAPSGAKTYTINGATYYVDDSEDAASLTATNERRSYLDIVKVVDGEDADPEQVFPFTITVKNSRAATGTADNLDSDYWVWFSVYNGGLQDRVVSTQVGDSGPVYKQMSDGSWTGYYYAKSETAVQFNLLAGDSLRFLNLPSGSTYTIVETPPESYVFTSSALEATTGEPKLDEDGNIVLDENGMVVMETRTFTDTNADETFKKGQTTSGTIVNPNTDYTVTYTNTYNLSDIEITKVWEDNDNQDGKRLSADDFKGKLTLKADGTDVTSANASKLTVTDNEDNTYTVKWTGLDRYADGKEIKYTVEESAIDGYDTEGSPAEDGDTITNSHTPEQITIYVKKIWVGPAASSGATIHLFAGKDDTKKSVTLTEATTTGSFADVDKYADGQEIAYTVTEDEITGYTTTGPTGTGTQSDPFVFTNTNDERITVYAEKVWDDADDQDGKRPDSVEFTLLADGKTIAQEGVTATAELDADGGWACSWANLFKYDQATGEEITYSISEGTVANYTASDPTGDGTKDSPFTITNSYTPETTEIEVTKVWDDSSDQDGKRPDSVTFTVTGSDKNTYEVELKGDGDTWTAKVEVQKYYDGGTEVTFTVDEEDVEDYTKTIDNGTLTITNKYEPEKKTLTVTKVWDDAGDQDGKRPESVEFTITGSDGKTYEATLEAPESGDPDTWTATVDVDKYTSGGETVTFTVDEEDVDDYEKDIDNDSLTITNKYTPETTELEVTKVWDDSSDQDGKRPDSVKFTVTGSDGNTYEATLSGEGDTWTAKIENVQMYWNHGTEVTFTVEEEEVKEYSSKTDNDTLTITNTYPPETDTLEVTKVWDDASDQDGKRPDSVKFTVTGSDGNTYEATLSGKGDTWTATIENVQKYWNHGDKVTFTVDEEDVEGYEKSIDNDSLTITNSYTPEKTKITVTKIWDDNSDQDGKRPDSVTFTITGSDGNTYTATLTGDGDEWTAEVEVEKYYNGGEEVTFTVDEEEVEGYEKSIDGLTITNSYETEKDTIKVTKIWDDNSNQDGKRPDSVTFTITGSDGNTYTATLSGDGDKWTKKVKVQKYMEGGKEVEFTVTEEAVEGYEATIDGLTITNSYTPETAKIKVTKIWDDNSNQDGKRPDSVTFTITGSDGNTYTAKLSGDGDEWTKTVKVAKYYNGGEEVTFTVDEEDVEGYEKSIDGLTITNSYETEKDTIKVTKIWDDNSNQDGKRPDSVTFTITGSDGNTYTATLSGDGDKWTKKVKVQKYMEGGKEVEFTVTEEAVEGYEATIDGLTITNSYETEKDTIKVTKIWDDANDQDGVRPESVTFTVTGSDGNTYDVELSGEGSTWTAEVEVEKYYNGGEEVTFTVDEAAVTDYTKEIDNDSLTITNSYKPGMQTLTVKKVWSDSNDQDGLRPDEITVKLLLEGKECEKVTLDESNGWKYSWDLPKKADGKDLIYTVDEDVVPDGYEKMISGSAEKGFIITNVHEITPPPPPPITDIRIEIIKVWEDNNNASGIRTDTVEVTLMVGDVKNLTRNLGDPNDWKYECYMPGGYDYRVVETPVEGYDSIVTQSPIPGGIRFTVTNKLTKTPDLNTKDHVAYIVGYPDGTVRPDRQITRAEVATIFFRLLTDEARDKFWSQTNPYPDVKADDWFNNAISTLTKMGIINGYEDGTFRPNNPITRAELTKMAVSFFSSADKFFGKTPSFSDVPADAWYTRFIAAAEELGLINGYPDGTFRPNNYITRAETCTIVNRTLGRGPHKDHLLPEEVMINWPDNLPTQWYYEQIQEATNSHDYEWITEIIEKTTVEQWLAKLPERDWVALEQIWSTAHSAPGGEVMG